MQTDEWRSPDLATGSEDMSHPRMPELASSRRLLLCATDLTSRSEHAMQRTALLARDMDARALFMHAVDETQSARVVRMKVNRSHVRLASEAERLMKHAPGDAQIRIELNRPLPAVASTARELRPDLIVMAAPRRRRFDAVLGTTAERVIRATEQPVLLVGAEGQRPYERVVLATDLSATSAHVARTVVGLGVLNNAYAWVVHAFDPPYHGLITSDVLSDERMAAYRWQWNDAVRRDVLADLTRAGVDLGQVHISTEQARPFAAIKRAMQSVRPELLVIGVSRWFMLKRLLLGSVADQVFRSIDCDVLAISPPLRRNWLRAA